MAARRGSVLRRLAFWILGLPILVVAILFAIENRGALALNFWPTGYVLTLPVYVAVFGAVVVGFLFGGTVAWLAQHHRRAAQRQAEREADRLRDEAERLQRRLDAMEAAQRPAIPPAAAPDDRARRQLVAAQG